MCLKKILIDSSCRLTIMISASLLSVACVSNQGISRENKSVTLPKHFQVAESKPGQLIFYRPKSEWANTEWEAPRVYINEQYVGQLKSGSALEVNLEQGAHHIILRRPLLGLEGLPGWDFGRYLDFGLRLKANEILVYRYQEQRNHENWAPSNKGFIKKEIGSQEKLSSIRSTYNVKQAVQSLYLASIEEEYRQVFSQEIKKEFILLK